MSNIAPFVAATLRDKVVHNLHKEIKSLREENQTLWSNNSRLWAEGATCTILITGPGGSPVFASATLSHRQVTEQLIAGGADRVRDPTTNLNVTCVQVSMTMKEWVVGATCRLDSFCDCQLELRMESGLGPDIVEGIGIRDTNGGLARNPSVNLAFNVRNGRFEVVSIHTEGVFFGVFLDAPIPPDRLDGLDERVRRGERDVGLYPALGRDHCRRQCPRALHLHLSAGARAPASASPGPGGALDCLREGAHPGIKHQNCTYLLPQLL